jgi:hypothetical protein
MTKATGSLYKAGDVVYELGELEIREDGACDVRAAVKEYVAITPTHVAEFDDISQHLHTVFPIEAMPVPGKFHRTVREAIAAGLEAERARHNRSHACLVAIHDWLNNNNPDPESSSSDD